MEKSQSSRASVRTSVIERLLAHSDAFQIPAVGLDIFAVHAFLTATECAGLIALIDRNRQPSIVLGAHPDPDFRTSESCNLDPNEPLVLEVEAKIAALMGIPESHGETIQGQRYAVGQQFKDHYDFFFTDQPYWPEQERIGGQRTWTAMMFLNEPEEGGQTIFEAAGVKIAPRTGNLLAWNNLDPAGEPSAYALHRGAPVEAGVKYVITKWFRERPWGHGAAPAY